MRCTYTDACLEFTSLQQGTLSAQKRFRLGRHIGTCEKCKLMLLILLDTVEKSGGPGSAHVRSLAVLADIDTTRIGQWLIAMFATDEVCGAR
jgi:hypothetical protein